MTRNWLPFIIRKTPVVRVRLGPSSFAALVDTGSELSLIAPDIAIIVGLPTVGSRMIVGVTGKFDSVPMVQLPEVGFGGFALAPCRAAVIDVKRLGLKIQLVLGVNAFANRRLQFDFKDERVYLVE